MEHFTSQKTLRHRPEYRHLVRQYNDTGTLLMRFELGVQERAAVKSASLEIQLQYYSRTKFKFQRHRTCPMSPVAHDRPPDFITRPQENWKNLRIHQIELMVSKSIFQDSGLSGSLESNFDPDFYTFLKENERLAKMDIFIPSVNQFLIKRKEYFSQYGDAVDMILFRWVVFLFELSDFALIFWQLQYLEFIDSNYN